MRCSLIVVRASGLPVRALGRVPSEVLKASMWWALEFGAAVDVGVVGGEPGAQDSQMLLDVSDR